MIALVAIQWSLVGVKAGQLLLCLTILVLLHELGHFLPAKWFKCRVEKFYLFFDAGFSLLKRKVGETVFGIGWLPLGGYVKIAGMLDESLDKEQMQKPPQPWEFRSKTPWQRLIIMIGGVTVNLVVGFLLFGMTAWVWGKEYLPAKNLIYGVYVDSLGKSIGLKEGDKIMAADGTQINDFAGLTQLILEKKCRVLAIIREGEQMDVPISDRTISQLVNLQGHLLAYPKFPAVVKGLQPGAQFISGKLQVEDQIIGLDDQPVSSFFQLRDLKKDLSNKEVALTVLRNKYDTVKVRVKLGNRSYIGFYCYSPDKFLKYEVKKYSFLESLPAGITEGWGILVENAQGFKLLLTNKDIKVNESLGGIITIGSMFSSEWDWRHFWHITAMISILLAFTNMLPIPALDGGHILFCLYEIITGRAVQYKVMEYAQLVGMVVILSVMIYALGLDIWRYILKN
ncbi:RIP metalloprotease RseP [Niastella sp. OAS944]|uniref:RIP metalloprotease RseP n=1 Tax=Niastella sp. OAS944 TaxID=2664089 RepID=UPI00348DD3C2|nr:regulator of sigma E protease [Chitinophagaceae bacterium OAS944]